MSSQTPKCDMYRDNYGCDGQSEVFLVIYPDESYNLYCRRCIDANRLESVKIFSLGHQVTL